MCSPCPTTDRMQMSGRLAVRPSFAMRLRAVLEHDEPHPGQRDRSYPAAALRVESAAAAFVTQYSAPGAIYVKWMGVDSTPAWMFDIQGNQQTTSWYAVLNLTTGNLVAVSPPGRWSGDHNSGDAGAGTTRVMFLGYCSYNGPFTGADNDLDGPFIAALETSPAASGSTTVTITTDGQPCDPTPEPG